MAKRPKRALNPKKALAAGEQEYLISWEAIESSTGCSERVCNLIARRLGREYNYWEVVVVTLDIRKSSIALVNVEDFAEYSDKITDYVVYVAETCRAKKYPVGRIKENGWFDKFTGDGVLLFWRLPEEPKPKEE